MKKFKKVLMLLMVSLLLTAVFTACEEEGNSSKKDKIEKEENDTEAGEEENGNDKEKEENGTDAGKEENTDLSAELIGKTYVYEDIEFNSDGWTGMAGGLFEGTINAVLDELTDEFEEISITFKTKEKAILQADNEKITVDYVVKDNKVSLFNDKGEEMKYSFEIVGKKLIMDHNKYGIGIKITLKTK